MKKITVAVLTKLFFVAGQFLVPWGAVHAQDSPILIGQTADLSGSYAVLVKETTAAAVAYFNKINAQGGVHGRRLELRSVDDGNNPQRALANVKKLAQDKALTALMLSYGTAVSEALLPLLVEIKVPLLGPVGSSAALHLPVNRYVFNLQQPAHVQASKTVERLNAQRLTQLAVVYSDDAFGKDAIDGFDKTMAAHSLKPLVRASIPPGSLDVDAVADKVALVKPHATLGICQPLACVRLLKALRAKGVLSEFAAITNLSLPAEVQALGALGHRVTKTLVFPHPLSPTPIAKELSELAQAAQFEASYASMEGLMSAKVMVKALQLAGANATPEQVTAALESLRSYDAGGVLVDFGPRDRTGSEYVDVVMISNEGKFIR